MTYNERKEDMDHSANRVFEMLKSNIIYPNIGNNILLSDIVDVHKALENRETKGSIVLKKQLLIHCIKKSLLFLEDLSFSSRNSIASVVPIGDKIFPENPHF